MTVNMTQDSVVTRTSVHKAKSRKAMPAHSVPDIIGTAKPRNLSIKRRQIKILNIKFSICRATCTLGASGLSITISIQLHAQLTRLSNLL